jgi:hypothetical protein
MGKKNQYYKLIEYVQKENIAKVFNFRTNTVEIYVTKLTNKEKYLQEKRRLEKKEIKEEAIIVLDKNDPVYKMYKSINYYANLYMIYSKFKLSRNVLIKSVLISRYLKSIEGSRYSANFISNFHTRRYKIRLDKSFRKYNNYTGLHLNLISVYIVLRRNNVYVTVMKDNQMLRIFSPRLFSHISKSGKKKSMSFFYTVKRTIMFITRFFFNKQKRYYLKIFFKGFQKFRRPLISRFFFNRRLKNRCLGIQNIDFESFNGCRLRKSKRIQIRGQRKQRKKFSF